MISSESNQKYLSKKSGVHNKREFFYQQRVKEEKDKIKKSLRFKNMADLVLSMNDSNYNFILELQHCQIEKKLRDFMSNQDSLSLTHCLFKIHQNYCIDNAFSEEFFQDLVLFLQGKINRPEIIFLLKCFAVENSTLLEHIFKRNVIVKEIMEQIQSFKEGYAQEIYLQVLQHITPSYLKRYNSMADEIFDVFSQSIDNKTIYFRQGLKILKTISPYISENKNFRESTVERIINSYEEQSKKKNPQLSLMQDCYVVIVKLIFYQKNIDIFNNFRLIRIVIHAKLNLPSKFVEQYYNAFLLLAKLVHKTGMFEIQQVTNQQYKRTMEKLKKQLPKMQFGVPISQNYLTSITLNYLFQQDQNLLNFKEFSISYLNFIQEVCIYCSTEVVLTHFQKNDFFNFLGSAIECRDTQINFLALQIIISLIRQELTASLVFEQIKDSNIYDIVSEKFNQTTSQHISSRIYVIMETFDLYDSH